MSESQDKDPGIRCIHRPVEKGWASVQGPFPPPEELDTPFTMLVPPPQDILFLKRSDSPLHREACDLCEQPTIDGCVLVSKERPALALCARCGQLVGESWAGWRPKIKKKLRVGLRMYLAMVQAFIKQQLDQKTPEELAALYRDMEKTGTPPDQKWWPSPP